MKKRKIRKILFKGNANISTKKLLKEMETAPWRFWRFWSKRSRYRPSTLEEDLINLKTLYRNEGFLDVAIEQDDVQILPHGNHSMDLLFNIEEGERLFFGDVTIVGNSVISTEELIKLDSREDKKIKKKGDAYSPLHFFQRKKAV